MWETSSCADWTSETHGNAEHRAYRTWAIETNDGEQNGQGDKELEEVDREREYTVMERGEWRRNEQIRKDTLFSGLPGRSDFAAGRKPFYPNGSLPSTGTVQLRLESK